MKDFCTSKMIAEKERESREREASKFDSLNK